jgi:hypothetical protein
MKNNKTFKLVERILVDHPEWNAKDIYDEYLTNIKDKREARTLNSIQKYVQKIKPSLQEVKNLGQEEQWHLGIKMETPLSADAIRYIMDVKYWLAHKAGKAEIAMIDNKKSEVISYLGWHFPTISIRQAKWISILYRLKNLEKVIKSEDIGFLWMISFFYAYYELQCKIFDMPFDTLWIDNAICFEGKDYFKKYIFLPNLFKETPNEILKKMYGTRREEREQDSLHIREQFGSNSKEETKEGEQ